MNESRRADLELDRGLVVESAPASIGRPAWPVLVVLVAAAFVLGTGTGYGIAAAPEASPSSTLAPTPSGTEVAPAAVPTAAPDPYAWPWLESQLPSTLQGAALVRTSVNSAGRQPWYEHAVALAAACTVDPGSVGWAEARQSGQSGGWSVQVYYVPGCPAETLLSVYQGDQVWEPIEIGAKHVKYHGGWFQEWAYARLQMLYIVSGWSSFPSAPDQMPEVVEILSGIR